MKRLLKPFTLFLSAAVLCSNFGVTALADTESQMPQSEAGDILSDYTETLYVETQTVSSDAKMIYLPDVTAEMSSVSYWSSKHQYPDMVLADQEMIDTVNQAILADSSTNVTDLSTWSQETFDGVAQNEAIVSSGKSDAEYFYNVGVRYADDGSKFSSFEEAMEKLFQPMIDNCVDPSATAEMSVRYAICTTRTTLNVYPTDHPLYDNPYDPDFDYLYNTSIRVNEPLVLKTTSADGKYYLAVSTCLSGWIPAEDVAICESKEEWLDAWHFPEEDTLVVYGDKIWTEDSNYAPETANRMLPMGTCLELVTDQDLTGLIINRRAYNNYVVWLPVRAADGSYQKVMGLIGENEQVHVGYLPVTVNNLLTVMMNQLGDTYGWGGMLESADCSGYARDVYKCFGVEMARNTTWQANQPVYKYDLSEMTDEEKADTIKSLPPGSLLIFRGHAMLYLGDDNDKLYVISSVSDLVIDGSVKRVRGAMINTLDIKRGNGNSWLTELHTAEIPFYPQGYDRPDPRTAVDASEIFEDVNAGDWYEEPVNFAYNYLNENGTRLMSGYEGGTLFGPADAVSRGQLAVMLHRFANEPETTVTGDEFPDVSAEDFYAEAAAWAKKTGNITGYDDGRFGGADEVTREQLATILYRYTVSVYGKTFVEEGLAAGSLNRFSDGSTVSGFAQEAMTWAVGAGLIKGSDDGTLNPLKSASRAECAAIFERYFSYLNS